MLAVITCGVISLGMLAALLVWLAMALRANGAAILAALALDDDRIEARPRAATAYAPRRLATAA